MPELSEVLASHCGSGYVVAPAGFGKTHLIAEAVARSDGRQLVLTHTYAGVNALRRKMRELGVAQRSFRIETIASWALRLSLSYGSTAGWSIERPEGDQWTQLYAACTALLDFAFIRRILRASYAGCYVDEYQDCSAGQHDVVLKLSRDLPCRVLGDPLQGIFDFNGDGVDWQRDVVDALPCLGRLETPHRWLRAGTPQIGAWLTDVRLQLEHHNSVALERRLPVGIKVRYARDGADLLKLQGSTCRHFACDHIDSVIAIHKGSQQFKAKCHNLARNAGGHFSSIEEIEGKALFSFIQKIARAQTPQACLLEVIAFAGVCLSALNANLPAATRRGEHTEVRDSTRHPRVALTANAYLVAPSSTTMADFLTAIRTVREVALVRADLFNRMLGVLRKQVLRPELTLREAAETYHAEFRHKGRPVGRRLIGTTLLVKGLEFDHAIVLDATSLSRKELYVAITRGCRSLTILSQSSVLSAAE